MMALAGGFDNAKVSSHNIRMRRKAGTLIPIEQSILAAAVHLRTGGQEEFHGFGIAKEIKDQKDARFLTGDGTLYKALGRLEQHGYLDSRWEDPSVAAEENRPRRKFYKLTAIGVTAGTTAHSQLSNNVNSGAQLKPLRATPC